MKCLEDGIVEILFSLIEFSINKLFNDFIFHSHWTFINTF